MTDEKKDYRYMSGDVMVEGYQITPATIHTEQDWPPWLTRQKLPDEINSVFIMQDNPRQLWLNLPTGEVELPALAWIVKHDNGNLGIVDALDFEGYVKVVPIPEKVHAPPADGMPDESHLAAIYPQHVTEGKTAEDYKHKAPAAAPAMAAAAPPADVAEMTDEVMAAIKLLKDVGTDGEPDLPAKAEEALDALIHCMSKRTVWCDCSPGICADKGVAGCRINSPLVAK